MPSSIRCSSQLCSTPWWTTLGGGGIIVITSDEFNTFERQYDLCHSLMLSYLGRCFHPTVCTNIHVLKSAPISVCTPINLATNLPQRLGNISRPVLDQYQPRVIFKCALIRDNLIMLLWLPPDILFHVSCKHLLCDWVSAWKLGMSQAVSNVFTDAFISSGHKIAKSIFLQIWTNYLTSTFYQTCSYQNGLTWANKHVDHPSQAAPSTRSHGH